MELEKKRSSALKLKAKKKKKPLGKVPSAPDVSVNGGEDATETLLEENGLSDQEGEKEQEVPALRLPMEGISCMFQSAALHVKNQKAPLLSARVTMDDFTLVWRAVFRFPEVKWL